MRPNQKSEDASLRFAKVLERMRAGTDMIDLDDVCAWEEDERVRKLGLPKAIRWGCTRIEVVYFCAFLRRMSKLLRRKEGEDLAFELSLLVDRWASRGLDRSLLEELVCHCYGELCREGGKPRINTDSDLTTKTPRHEENQGSLHSSSRSPESRTEEPQMHADGHRFGFTTKTPRHEEFGTDEVRCQRLR
jgi:hypothetical protein